jgi:subtilisin family serine protease
MKNDKSSGGGRAPRESGQPAQPAKATRAGAEAELTPTAAEPTTPTDAAAEPRPVGPRRERYLVAPLPPPVTPQGFMPFAAPIGSMMGRNIGSAIGNIFGGDVFGGGGGVESGSLVAQLNADPAVTVHKVLRPTNQLSSFGSNIGAEFPEVMVVEMDPDRASMFAAAPMVHVEPDLPVIYCEPDGTDFADPGLVPLGEQTAMTFVIHSSDGQPLPGAEVYLMSNTFPVRGTSGPDGTAQLDVPVGSLANIRGIYVKPANDHWSIWFAQPDLSPGAPNLLTLPRLTDTFPGFPARQMNGWGRRAMRFDALPPNLRGHGVKIAIVDSGAAVEHPDLVGRVVAGRDIPGQNDTGWRVDTVGHGSHCAGIIGGTDDGAGIVGLVPEAEIHSCKIFPGGRFSDLIEALDYCIANNIDVVNMSLGSTTPSELVAAKVEQARQAGVACVVAAGNSGGPVAFPASMSSVLAVAAIGKIGEYPPESYHATQVAGAPTAEGYFSAKFTCFGPEIDVCGPGVAIVSSVPPRNFAAFDGTSFAGPHVAALAALVLAHHADFRDRFMLRNAARVDRLFEIIRGSARPLALGDPGRSGAGLPDATIALGAVTPSPALPGFGGFPGRGFPGGFPVGGFPGGGVPGFPVGAFPGLAGLPGFAGPGLPGMAMMSPAAIAALWTAALAQSGAAAMPPIGIAPGAAPASGTTFTPAGAAPPAGAVPPAAGPPTAIAPAGTGQPGAGQPGAAQPGTGQPSAAQPGTGQPGAAQPGTGQPSAAQPSETGAVTPAGAEVIPGAPAGTPATGEPTLPAGGPASTGTTGRAATGPTAAGGTPQAPGGTPQAAGGVVFTMASSMPDAGGQPETDPLAPLRAAMRSAGLLPTVGTTPRP